MFKNILIATDNSPAIENAMRYVANIFPYARFYIIYVVNTSDGSVPMTNLMIETLEKIGEEAIEKSREVMEDMGITDATYEIRKGVPSKEILSYVNEKKIELLVLARHSKLGGQAVHLGKTCMRVLEHIHCPVMVVPPEFQSDRQPESVFNPTSGSTYSMSASELAVLVADHFRARLFALFIGKSNGERVLDAISTMAERLNVEFSGRICEGRPDKEILEEAKNHDIMVMSRGYRGLKYKFRFFDPHLALGKLEREVLAGSPIPVIVVSD